MADSLACTRLRPKSETFTLKGRARSSSFSTSSTLLVVRSPAQTMMLSRKPLHSASGCIRWAGHHRLDVAQPETNSLPSYRGRLFDQMRHRCSLRPVDTTASGTTTKSSCCLAAAMQRCCDTEFMQAIARRAPWSTLLLWRYSRALAISSAVGRTTCMSGLPSKTDRSLRNAPSSIADCARSDNSKLSAEASQLGEHHMETSHQPDEAASPSKLARPLYESRRSLLYITALSQRAALTSFTTVLCPSAQLALIRRTCREPRPHSSSTIHVSRRRGPMDRGSLNDTMSGTSSSPGTLRMAVSAE